MPAPKVQRSSFILRRIQRRESDGPPQPTSQKSVTEDRYTKYHHHHHHHHRYRRYRRHHCLYITSWSRLHSGFVWRRAPRYLLFYLSIYLSIFICSLTNHTAQQREKNSGTGRTRLTALTAALRNGKMKTKVVTTSTSNTTLRYVWFIETTNIPLPRFERTLTGVAAKMPQ